MSLARDARRGSRRLVLLAALTIGILAVHGAGTAQAGHCVENTGGGWTCSWGYNGETGSGAWWFFDGANPGRNWYANQGADFYANHVYKCVRAGLGGGQIYRQTCNNNQTTAQSYARCNCGGVYVGTYNGASGPRQINSMGWH